LVLGRISQTNSSNNLQQGERILREDAGLCGLQYSDDGRELKSIVQLVMPKTHNVAKM
jgi:hypothetical protein